MSYKKFLASLTAAQIAKDHDNNERQAELLLKAQPARRPACGASAEACSISGVGS